MRTHLIRRGAVTMTSTLRTALLGILSLQVMSQGAIHERRPIRLEDVRSISAHAYKLIPEGHFRMGSPTSPDRYPPRWLEIEGFFIARYPITRGEYAQFKQNSGERSGDRHPAVGMTIKEAQDYCRWLSERTGLAVRLPTEVEWEYAARGGIHGAPYPWGWGNPSGKACFNAKGPTLVGQFDPNPSGLFDMAGNTYEWCLPVRHSVSNIMAVARGGSWAEKDPRTLQLFRNAEFRADYQGPDVGFRVLIELYGPNTD